jgi:hypothetical protein
VHPCWGHCRQSVVNPEVLRWPTGWQRCERPNKAMHLTALCAAGEPCRLSPHTTSYPPPRPRIIVAQLARRPPAHPPTGHFLHHVRLPLEPRAVKRSVIARTSSSAITRQ